MLKLNHKKMMRCLVIMMIILVCVNLPVTYAVTTSDSSVVGKYIQFGAYSNSPVVYRVIGSEDVNNDGMNELLLWSDKMICFKPYDGKSDDIGNRGAATSFPTARLNKGSNFWPESNLRDWLNSSNDVVSWTGAPPILENVGGDAYDTEKGFMANLTAAERNAVIPVIRKTIISQTDKDLKTGGSSGHTWASTSLSASLTNYDTTALYVNTIEKIFILSLKELNSYAFPIYGSDTALKGTKRDGLKNDADQDTNQDGAYWVRDAKMDGSVSAGCDARVFSSLPNDYVNSVSAFHSMGIRPAFYISSGLTLNGDGTSTSPYQISFPPLVEGYQFKQGGTAINTLTSGSIDVDISTSNGMAEEPVLVVSILMKITDKGDIPVKKWVKSVSFPVGNNKLQITNLEIGSDEVNNHYLKTFVVNKLDNGKAYGDFGILGSEPTMSIEAGTASGRQIEITEFKIDPNSPNWVSIKGIHPAGMGSTVNISVMKDSDLELCYINQIKTATNGGFWLKGSLCESGILESLDEGWYTMYVSGNSALSAEPYHFALVGEQTYKDALNILNTGSKSEVIAMLSGSLDANLKRTVLEQHGCNLSAYDGLVDKDKFVDAIIAGRLTGELFTVDNTQTMFNKYLYFVSFSISDTQARIALVTNTDVSNALGIRDIINVSYYERLDKIAIYGDLGQLSDPTALKTALHNKIIILGMNSSQNASQIKEIIEAEAAYLNITFPIGYSNLSDYYMKRLYDKLVGKGYLSIDLINTDFMNAWNDITLEIAQAKAQESQNTKPPSGGGGGTGGYKVTGGTNVITPPPVEPPKDTDEFSDITNYLWAKDAINSLKEQGIVDGVGNKTFNPEGNVKREEFVKMLVKTFSFQDSNIESPFRDIDGSAWYAKYIKSAYSNEVINGDNGLFGVGQNITREDLAVIIYRAMNKQGIHLVKKNAVTSFHDSASISDYAKDAVTELMQAGIINGMEGGNFAPKSSATRAQVAKLIYEVYNLIKGSGL